MMHFIIVTLIFQLLAQLLYHASNLLTSTCKQRNDCLRETLQHGIQNTEKVSSLAVTGYTFCHSGHAHALH